MNSSTMLITVAYGVRNFEDLDKGFSEDVPGFHDPEGVLLVIELWTPEKFPFRELYHLYSGYMVIPTLGRFLSKEKKAYTYLPKSIKGVPQGNNMLKSIS